MKREDDPLWRALNDNSAQTGTLQAFPEIRPNLAVFDELDGIITVCVPVRIPASNDAESKSDRMRFLTQC